MNAVRIAVGCAVIALVAGSALSRLSPAERDGFVANARALVGGAPPTSAAPLRGASTSRVASAVAEAPSIPSASGEVIAPDRRGQFEAAVEVEGQSLAVLIDTGATFVALSFEDADRLGIRPMPADFRLPMMTANGRSYVAQVRLASVRLGAIVVRDVPAVVGGRGQIGQTLLGMSFLSRLSTMRVEGGRMILAQ